MKTTAFSALFLFWVVTLISFPDLVHRIQNHWFPIPRETFNVVMYSFLGNTELFLPKTKPSSVVVDVPRLLVIVVIPYI